MAGSVTCPSCGATFKSGPALRIHLITKHSKR
jgi:hypothetical protein